MHINEKRKQDETLTSRLEDDDDDDDDDNAYIRQSH